MKDYTFVLIMLMGLTCSSQSVNSFYWGSLVYFNAQQVYVETGHSPDGISFSLKPIFDSTLISSQDSLLVSLEFQRNSMNDSKLVFSVLNPDTSLNFVFGVQRTCFRADNTFHASETEDGKTCWVKISRSQGILCNEITSCGDIRSFALFIDW